MKNKTGHINNNFYNYSLLIFLTKISVIFLLVFHNNFAFADREDLDRMIHEELVRQAREINNQLPMMIDQDTRVDSAFVVGKNIFYKVTVLKINASDIEGIDISILNKELVDHVNYNACRMDETRVLIDFGVSFVWMYYDVEGKILTRFILDEYNCD